MGRRLDALGLMGNALFSSWTCVLFVLAIAILVIGSAVGPPPGSAIEKWLKAADPFRWPLALALIVLSAYIAVYKSMVRAEQRFYSVSTSARLEHVHLRFYRLLCDGEAILKSSAEIQQELFKKWDADVQRACATYLAPWWLAAYTAESKGTKPETGSRGEAFYPDRAIAWVRRTMMYEREFEAAIIWDGFAGPRGGS